MRCTPAPSVAGVLLALAVASSAGAQAPARTVALTTPIAADSAAALGGVATALYGVRRRDVSERSQLAARVWSGTAATIDVTRAP